METGTIRDENGCGGDGWSTVAWGWYAGQKGGRVYSVDVSESAIETCRRITADFAAAITYVCADSLDFFAEWAKERRGAIDLLYLDSLDYHHHAESEAHHLAEARAALPLLATPCLVLFDDTQLSGDSSEDGRLRFSGKGALAAPFLRERGFRLEWAEGGQVLLSRGAQPMNG